MPYIVNAASLYGTGNLPKFRDDLFNAKIREIVKENRSQLTVSLYNTCSFWYFKFK